MDQGQKNGNVNRLLIFIIIVLLIFGTGAILDKNSALSDLLRENKELRIKEKELNNFIEEQGKRLQELDEYQKQLDNKIKEINKQKEEIKKDEKEYLALPPIRNNDSLRNEILRVTRLDINGEFGERDGTLYKPGGQRDTGYLVFKDRRRSLVPPR